METKTTVVYPVPTHVVVSTSVPAPVSTSMHLLRVYASRDVDGLEAEEYSDEIQYP